MRDNIDLIPRVPDRGHESEISRQRRLDWIREQTGAGLPALDRFDLDPTRLVGNIENLVGSVSIPVGLAGPLHFRGEHATGAITAPFATTEGALVASATRGAHAVSRAGGVATRVLRQQMVRSPRFDLDDVVSAHRFAEWALGQQDTLAEQVADVSRHARLIGLRPMQIGRSVDLIFEYETGDASGQNMTTACTWRACLWIEKQLADDPEIGLRSFCVEGNTAGDKKLSQNSLLNGRGMRVTAECRIDATTLGHVLKVSPQDLVRAFNINVIGTALGGGIAPNINVANAIAAIFAATGQDIACVHESGAGILNIEPDGDGVYASMLLPALAVGTVGGGTSLPQQADYLAMLGCGGTGTAARLAEVIAGYALALDLSTLSAVIGGQFATAHERLGRNRPIRWFTRMDLTPEFFADTLADHAPDDPAPEVDSVKVLGDATDASVISELTHRVSTQKLVGVLPVDVHLTGTDEPIELMVKAKPLDGEVVLAAHRLVSLAGGRLAEAWSRGSDVSGFLGTHMRELALYRDPGPLAAIMPRCYGIHADPGREAYLLLLERLGDEVILTDSGDRPQDWTLGHIRTALTGIAGVHGHWYDRTGELAQQSWLGPPTEASRVVEMTELWRGLYEHHRREYPQVITEEWLAETIGWIDTLADWWPELAAMPNTLVHNDFNSRNIGLRRIPAERGGADPAFELVAYDWELTTLHVPQRDLVELLAYVLTPDVSAEVVDGLIDHHRAEVAAAAGRTIDTRQWRRGYRLALADFVIRRLSLYLMVHTEHRLPFIERVVATVGRLHEIEREHAAHADPAEATGGGAQAAVGERAAR